jgi:hypothetical protein
VIEEFNPPKTPFAFPDNFNPMDTEKLCRWCREYCKTESPTDAASRFAIALYQIGQAKEWELLAKQTCEGALMNWASAVLHFIGTAEILAVRMAEVLPQDLALCRYPYTHENKYAILCDIGIAQQMIVYRNPHITKRDSLRWNRYEATELRKRIQRIVEACVSKIPTQHKNEMFEMAIGQLIHKEYRI